MPVSPSASRPSATIVITTRNRRDVLREALVSALGQDGDVEVLVVDDASEDGTADMVRAEFPEVRLVVNDVPQGYIVGRNRAAALASAPIVVSLDDDAVLSTPSVVARTLEDFDDERIGAVAIPYIDVNQGGARRQHPPDGQITWVTSSFVGTAHAVRRELFVLLGGYRELLVHQSEEADFCLRLLAAGYVTRLGRADAILHYESPLRDPSRALFYGRRNDLLYAWHNVPMPYAAGRALKVTVDSVRLGVRARRLRVALRGVVRGFRDMLAARAQRQPVSAAVYRLNRRLRLRGPVLLDEARPHLPPAARAAPAADYGGRGRSPAAAAAHADRPSS